MSDLSVARYSSVRMTGGTSDGLQVETTEEEPMEFGRTLSLDLPHGGWWAIGSQVRIEYETGAEGVVVSFSNALGVDAGPWSGGFNDTRNYVTRSGGYSPYTCNLGGPFFCGPIELTEVHLALQVTSGLSAYVWQGTGAIYAHPL